MIDDEELKERYAARQPYGEWLDSNLVQLADLKIPNRQVRDITRQRTAGQAAEGLRLHL